MKLSEFLEQDKYCRENNIPEGEGCNNCPAEDKEHCADALRKLASEFIANFNKPVIYEISRQLNQFYDLNLWNQLALIKGEMEFPE